jgi:uncharacterized protein (TIGR03435 family)
MKLIAMIALLSIAQAQPAFEVASVKPGLAGAGVRGGCHGIDSRYAPNEAASAPPLGRCVIRNGRLGHLLLIAYRLHSMSFVDGGLDWVKTGEDRFNIEAILEDPTKATEQQLYQMLQALLTERFNLKFHKETRYLPGFALTVAKNGPKLKQASGEDVVADWGASFGPIRGPNTMTVRHYSMAMLADTLDAGTCRKLWHPWTSVADQDDRRLPVAGSNYNRGQNASLSRSATHWVGSPGTSGCLP